MRAEDWLDEALPQVNRDTIDLDVSPSGSDHYIRTMFDLIVLALETDNDACGRYQILAEDGVGVCDRLPIDPQASEAAAITNSLTQMAR